MSYQKVKIEGYPNHLIDTKGNVWSTFRAEKRLKPFPDRDGYLCVTLRKTGNGVPKRFYVHRLMGEAFINNSDTDYSGLSPREYEVCNMIKQGLSSKDIASTLNTSVHTVHTQRRNIRKKLRIKVKSNLYSFLQPQ